MIPGLRRLVHLERGITPARLRGVRETASEWVAFLDADNLPASDWTSRRTARRDAISFVRPTDWAVLRPASVRSFGLKRIERGCSTRRPTRAGSRCRPCAG